MDRLRKIHWGQILALTTLAVFINFVFEFVFFNIVSIGSIPKHLIYWPIASYVILETTLITNNKILRGLLAGFVVGVVNIFYVISVAPSAPSSMYWVSVVSLSGFGLILGFVSTFFPQDSKES